MRGMITTWRRALGICPASSQFQPCKTIPTSWRRRGSVHRRFSTRPWDFNPSDQGLEACAFGTDEFVKQQRHRVEDIDSLTEEVEKAKASALRMLGRRAHARKELKRKLEDKGYRLDAIENALDRLEKVGLQSDVEFAEAFARSKWRQTKWGPDKIKSELHHRGIPLDIAEKGVRSVFGSTGLDMKRFLDSEMPQEESDTFHASQTLEGGLLAASRKQWEISRNLKPETRKRRLVSWLQRRGHSWENISRILRIVEDKN